MEPRALHAHSRPPPKNPRFTGEQNWCQSLLTGAHLLTPSATHGGPRPFADQTCRTSAPSTGACIWCSSLRACPSNGAGTEGPRPARRPAWAAGTKAYGRRRPEATEGSCAAAGPGRRKERDAPQLSGGYPGGPPPGHALWVLSLVQEKVPRPPVREPAIQSACRNPPAKVTRPSGRKRKPPVGAGPDKLWCLPAPPGKKNGGTGGSAPKRIPFPSYAPPGRNRR